MAERLCCGVVAMFLLLAGCGEHAGHQISEYRGDFRFDGAIGEFFDCYGREKYFIAKAGLHKELQHRYEKLNLADKHDAYIIVQGYVKREKMPDGIDPVEVFVVADIVDIDASRGCQLGNRPS